MHENEKEQTLHADREAFAKAEAEPREHIETPNAAARQRSAEGHRADEEAAQLAELESLRVAAESKAQIRATEKQRLTDEIKSLSQVAIEQIDRMEEAKARLAVLEELRIHAETKVYECAEREMRLQAEIEALRQAEAAQLKRIEEAEAEERRLIEEQTCVQAADEARWKMEAEARRRAAAEALRQVEDETLRLAEEEEHRLEHLETIRARAQAAADQRAEKEQVLNAQLLAFGEAAAEQLKRIEKAEADLREAEEAFQQFEEKSRQTVERVRVRLAEIETHRQAVVEDLAHAEAEARAPGEEDEQRRVELESIRGQTETRLRQRRDQEERLIAEIEALNKSEAEQLNRIADAEVALVARDEELQAADFDGDPEEVDRRTEVVADPTDEAIDSVLQAGQAFLPVLARLEGLSCQAASEEAPVVTSVADLFGTSNPADRTNPSQEITAQAENAAFSSITDLFDDSSEEVRNAAARALYDLSTARAETFTRALREAPPERRRQIIRALDGSGLAAEAIDSLAGESREKTHDAFSMLFLMAKAGEVQSLLQTIEKHPSSPVRLSVIKLLTFSNRPDIIPSLRSLAVRGALPIEVRSALMESIYEMSTNARERSLSAA